MRLAFFVAVIYFFIRFSFKEHKNKSDTYVPTGHKTHKNVGQCKQQGEDPKSDLIVDTWVSNFDQFSSKISI